MRREQGIVRVVGGDTSGDRWAGWYVDGGWVPSHPHWPGGELREGPALPWRPADVPEEAPVEQIAAACALMQARSMSRRGLGTGYALRLRAVERAALAVVLIAPVGAMWRAFPI